MNLYDYIFGANVGRVVRAGFGMEYVWTRPQPTQAFFSF